MWILTVILCAGLTSNAASQCDNGWQLYSGHCYFLSDTAALTEVNWHEARAYCLQNGAELSSIHSQQEQEHILTMAEDEGYGGDVWIGLNQFADRESDHSWSDGSELTFEAWAPDQPNRGGDEKCIYSSTIAASYCYERLHSISTVDGIISSPQSPPPGCSRAYGGSDAAWCEQQCDNKPYTECYAYTFFSKDHPDTVWEGECLTCSQEVVGENRVTNQYATSGIRIPCDDTGTEFWYSANCGWDKGFVCKKPEGSSGPATVPPTQEVPGYCPKGFFGFGGNKCYKVVQHTFQTGISWDEARSNCLAEPGIQPDLVSISTIQEQAEISALLTDYSWGYWIGFRKYGNTWLWTDNSDPTFTNWAEDMGYLDCAEVQIYPKPHGTWDTLGCGDRRGMICQTFKDPGSIILSSPSPTNCPSGFTSYWYGCYKLELTSRTFSEADAECRTQGSHLVSIHDEAENSAVYTFARQNFPIWIGLQDNNDEYKWLDGWPELYTKWGAGEPDKGEGCVAMEIDSRWNDTQCSRLLPFMCKYTEAVAPTTPAPKEGVCPGNDWDEWGGHCFYFSSEMASWDNAVEQCRTRAGIDHNGDLASIHNAVTNEWVFQTFKERGISNGAWIGLRRADLDSPWEWTNKEPFNYHRWGPGKPDDEDGTQTCVEIYTTSWPGMWNDHGCSQQNPYLCMAQKIPPPTIPTMPPEVPGECPGEQWVHYGDACFLFKPDEYADWSEAHYGCTQAGGTALASIRDGAENWFIHQKLVETSNMPVRRPAWIGLVQTSEDSNDEYHWFDGTPLEYVNWGPGEPSGSDQRCVDMHSSDGMWNDNNCNPLAGYVCKYTKAPDCDDTWQGHGEHCYFLSDTAALTEVNWHEARAYCLQFGAELTSIHSQQEQEHILKMAFDKEYDGNIWIGLNQLEDRDADYSWTDGGNINYEAWAADQPNRNGREKCIYSSVESSDNEFWHSANCGEKAGFVCKKLEGSSGPATVPPTQEVPGSCPQDYFGIGNKCYKLFSFAYPNGVTWYDALTTCRQEPGIQPDLASISSIHEQAIITAALSNYSWGYWIGYSRIGGNWLWTDNSDPTFTYWDPNPQDEFCAKLNTYPNVVGTWNTLGCSDNRGYICQTYKDINNIETTPDQGNCPAGFTSYWYGCYKLEEIPRTFLDAYTVCRDLDSDLVSIHSEPENAAVFALAGKNYPLWIGLQYGSSGYRWLDGWPGLYSRWGAGEPDRVEGCVAMEEDGRWNDTKCSDEKPFMCKYTDVAAPTTPAPVEGTCPDDDWEEWGGFCFYFSSADATWDSAVDQCKTRAGNDHNGDLASIHNAVTNEWLYQTLQASGLATAWIGLRKMDFDSPWEWNDGSPLYYLNWAPGEPNDDDGSQTCVEMYVQTWPGQWNDHYCSDWKPYVCMAEKVALAKKEQAAFMKEIQNESYGSSFNFTTAALIGVSVSVCCLGLAGYVVIRNGRKRALAPNNSNDIVTISGNDNMVLAAKENIDACV